ncbi:hypothetical protein XELAEV_18046392mg [Xenopus laevis]|uniref:Uncharacterized protein n=1 Tax=Xenopus laevis TaxID=8355 RepID=A0A974BT15_XENLA|nr:hypothetical protein XELAEV_18046392mg [Xenopus laevis]
MRILMLLLCPVINCENVKFVNCLLNFRLGFVWFLPSVNCTCSHVSHVSKGACFSRCNSGSVMGSCIQ